MASSKRIDTLGLKINEWTALSNPYKIGRYEQYFVDCECSCGTKRAIQYTVFTKGHRKACSKCSNIAQRTIKKGDRFGKWTVLEAIPRGEKKTLWKCICACGRIGKIEVTQLKKGRSSQCASCAMSLRPFDKYGRLYWNILESIKKRGLKVEITKEDIERMFISQKGLCALSGVSIGFARDSTEYDLATVSVDRIDSNGDYTRDNVHLVHKDINRMKNAFDPHYFITMCNNVAATHPLPSVEVGHNMHCSKPSKLPCRHSKVEFKCD